MTGSVCFTGAQNLWELNKKQEQLLLIGGACILCKSAGDTEQNIQALGGILCKTATEQLGPFTRVSPRVLYTSKTTHSSWGDG